MTWQSTSSRFKHPVATLKRGTDKKHTSMSIWSGSLESLVSCLYRYAYMYSVSCSVWQLSSVRICSQDRSQSHSPKKQEWAGQVRVMAAACILQIWKTLLWVENLRSCFQQRPEMLLRFTTAAQELLGYRWILIAENWILLRSIATIGSYWMGCDSKLPPRPTCQASDDSNWTAGRRRVLKLSEIDLTDDPSWVLQTNGWSRAVKWRPDLDTCMIA